MKAENKFVLNIKKSSDNSYTAYASTIRRDRSGEIVLPKGCINMTEFIKQNPVVFYDHNWIMGQGGEESLPVGKALTLSANDQGVLTTFRFSSLAEKDGEFANKVKALVDDDILKALSIGFIPKKFVYNVDEIANIMKENSIPVEETPYAIITEWEILEYSIVGVPANRESLIMNSFTPDKAEKLKSFLDDLHKIETTKRKEDDKQNIVKQPLSVAEKMASVLRK
jgi:hypothetical protein